MTGHENKSSTQRRRGHRDKRREDIGQVFSLRLPPRSLRLCVEEDTRHPRNL